MLLKVDQKTASDRSVNDLLPQSTGMKKMIERVKQFALTGSTIIIIGETGTGKEILAQSIHNLSQRAKQAFVSINCAALFKWISN